MFGKFVGGMRKVRNCNRPIIISKGKRDLYFAHFYEEKREENLMLKRSLNIFASNNFRFDTNYIKIYFVFFLVNTQRKGG